MTLFFLFSFCFVLMSSIMVNLVLIFTMVDTIKIVTVNYQGLGTPSKRRDVLNFYKSKGYSIICLQDTHFTPELETCVETQCEYKCVFSSFCSSSRGVAVLFNSNFELQLHKEKKMMKATC